jgi:hypothetical protein
MAALALVAAAPAAGAVGADPSYPERGYENLPWPSLLPSLPVTAAVQPHPMPNCEHASLACVDGLMERLESQWRELDAACDHRALFSLAYLRITEGLRDELAPGRAGIFRYPRWMTYLITTFSNRYFEAFAAYEGGRPVPDAWRITFDEALHGDANGGQDTLLASNAHTQHDLPFALAEMGLRTPGGASRKHDHDAVNEINARVFDGIEEEYAQRYDPFFGPLRAMPVALDQAGTSEFVKVWREGAWRNAERLLRARTPEERRRVEREIDLTSRTWAELIRSGDVPGYRAVRDAHCRAYHAAG